MNGKLLKVECDVCKRDREAVEAMSTSVARAIKLVYKLEVQPTDLRICDKCNFHIILMQTFMENLVRFNFPTLTASKSQCFSCHSVKIVHTMSMNHLVRELEDFHASPKSGAQYYACIDCVYKTRALVKYKNLLANLRGRAMEANIVDDLLHKMKRTRPMKKQRKQQGIAVGPYKLDQLPKFPVVSVCLERLPPPPQLNGFHHPKPNTPAERIGRPLKRKLDRDFIYDMSEINKHTNDVIQAKVPSPSNSIPKPTKQICTPLKQKTNPIVILEKIDPKRLLIEAARPDTPQLPHTPPPVDPFLPHVQTSSPLRTGSLFNDPSSSSSSSGDDDDDDDDSEGETNFVLRHELNTTYPFLPELIQAPYSQRKSVSFSEDVEVIHYLREEYNDIIHLDDLNLPEEATEVPQHVDDPWLRVIESALGDI